eukprot:TRINITY_DN18305_c2_g1_i1.p1 TRINITY_DN18305_c2_g1~~TRINITY_DN18305_c2_g1_i1.p1  ORF type:complete len:430 (-),score=74.62 TRINITY_DN18305_c2_g1_i1:1102-2391(-)
MPDDADVVDTELEGSVGTQSDVDEQIDEELVADLVHAAETVLRDNPRAPRVAPVQQVAHKEEPLQAATDEMLEELENFAFPAEEQPDEDSSGRLAYVKKCQEFDFFMWPINSITEKFDSEILALPHAGLGDKGAIALAESLKINTRIHDVALVDNWITPKGALALLEAITHATNITRLDLSENRLGYRGGHIGSDTVGASLQNLLKVNSALIELSLRANKLGDKDVTAICDGLCENFSLHALDISYNEIGPPAGEAVGVMLSTNGDLRELNLEWNQLRNQGTLAVLNGLKQNNVLKRISLAWCGLSDRGGIAVGEVLHGNTSLEEVDVSHNRISELGAMKIAEGLTENAAIKRLNLSFNPLRDDGCAAIVAAIRTNQSLVFVDLKNTESGPNAARELQETRKKKGNRVEINIPRSFFVPKDISAQSGIS